MNGRRRIIKRLTATEVVAKQEEYRRRTIQLVAELLNEGMEKSKIAEEVGISVGEISEIIKIIEADNEAKKPRYRRFF